MFLQSQKKKSSIKPKTSEKKKKPKSKIKVKKKVDEEQEENQNDPQKNIEEVIVPVQEEPIKGIPIQQPEPVMNIENPPKQESEKEISRIRKDKRFNQRQGAKFGYNFNDDIEESDGPQLFVYEDKQKPSHDNQMRYAATEYKPPKTKNKNTENDFFPKNFQNRKNKNSFELGEDTSQFQKKTTKMNSEFSPIKISNKTKRRVNVFEDNEEPPKLSIDNKLLSNKPKQSESDNNKILGDSQQMLNKDGTMNFENIIKRSNIKQSIIQNEDNNLNKLLTNQPSEEKTKSLNFYYGKSYNTNQTHDNKEENIRPIRKSHKNSQNILSGFIKDGNPGLLIKEGSNMRLNSFQNNSYRSKKSNRSYNDSKNEPEIKKSPIYKSNQRTYTKKSKDEQSKQITIRA